MVTNALVVLNLQPLLCKLSAGNDNGPSTDHPSSISAPFWPPVFLPKGVIAFIRNAVVSCRLVNCGVKHFDDLPRHTDRVGNKHRASYYAPQAGGKAGFSIAGGSIEKDRLPRVDRRSQEFAHLLLQHQVAQTSFQVLARDDGVSERLLPNDLTVLVKRNRHRPSVSAAGQYIIHPFSSSCCQGVFIELLHWPLAAHDLNQALTLQELQDAVGYREGNGKCFADIYGRGAADEEDFFQH